MKDDIVIPNTFLETYFPIERKLGDKGSLFSATVLAIVSDYEMEKMENNQAMIRRLVLSRMKVQLNEAVREINEELANNEG